MGRTMGASLSYHCDSGSMGDELFINASIQTESGGYLTLLSSNDPTGQSKGNNNYCLSAIVQAPFVCTVYVEARPLAGLQNYRLTGGGLLVSSGAPGGFPEYTGPWYAIQ